MRFICLFSLLSLICFAGHNELSELEKKEGWVHLFNGKDLTGWTNFNSDKIKEGGWIVEDGCLRMVKDGEDIVSTKNFKDFEIKLEWKISEKGNSGIFFRCDPKNRSGSPEMQILDDLNHGNGKDPKTSAGALYGVIPAPKGVSKSAMEWHQVHAILKGTHYQFFLNGVKTADFDTQSEEFLKLKSEGKMSKKKNYAQRLEGVIVLQDHGKSVWFRNIKVREL
ncbi:MAG: DUF1080 domain-containing protein [Planctomycetes bacterium]|nr:DUF1080 domain-containing protein [Planctomycetota bacterium]